MADAQIKITADTAQAERALGSVRGALVEIGSIIFGANVARQLYEITAATQEMTNKLIFATGSLGSANQAFDLLAASAKNTGSNLGGSVDLFQKLAQSSTLAGSSQVSLVRITENFNKTLQISGASGAAASSALYQFAQAMQKGTLNGDEFRTMSETNGFLLKVLEEQTGMTASGLRQMASDGKLSAEIIARALTESDKIAKEYGQTIRTLPQAFENLNTALTQAVKKFDDATGASRLLVNVLEFFTKNQGALIGAIAGLGVAVLGLLVVLIPAATMMAVLTGGVAVAGAIAIGAALGIAADQAGAFGDNNKKASDALKVSNEEAAKGLKITTQRGQAAEDLDKSLGKNIAALKAANDVDSQATGIKSLQLDVTKAVALEQAKYAEIGKQMLPEQEKALRNETARKILTGERITTEQQLLKLTSDTLTLNQQDLGQRQITSKLEDYRLGVTKETYAANQANLALKIQENLTARLLSDLTASLRVSQAELNNLTVKDLDTRSIELEVAKQRLANGVLFTAQAEATLRATLANNQATREALATEQQLGLLRGTATPQTREQRIQTATGVVEASDPRLAMAQDYATKKRAIDEAIAVNEKLLNSGSANDYAILVNAKETLDIDYRNKKELADIEFNNRELLRAQAQNDQLIQLQNKIFEAKKLADIQAATGSQFGYETQKTMAKEAADFEKKSALEKAQFGIEQGANLFSTLGQQNRQAFEASKAMNIAMAIMNTYMGATKALATYPWPFGLIAAAAAVAAGMAQVGAIRSQQYTGRAMGGPVASGTPYIVGEQGRELFVPSTSGTIIPNSQMGGGGGMTTVNFNITANDTQGFDELLMKRRGLITQVIRDSQLERGQRIGA